VKSDQLAALAENFFNAYVLGTPLDPAEALASRRLAGIRRRFPAVVSFPPEYEPLPNGFHNQVFTQGQGPEAFGGANRYRYLDRCPLERTLVTFDDNGVHVQFIFVVRYGPRQFEPQIEEFVCLPSGDECSSIVSECLNRFQDFLGTDDGQLVGDSESLFSILTSDSRVLSNDEFLPLEIPDVLPR
jgi:hypothetical protein